MKTTQRNLVLLLKKFLSQKNMIVSPFMITTNCLFLDQVTSGTTRTQLSKKLRLYKIDLDKSQKQLKKITSTKGVNIKSFINVIPKIKIPNKTYFRPIVVKDRKKIEKKYNLKLKLRKNDRFIISSLLSLKLKWKDSFESYKGHFHITNDKSISTTLLHTIRTFSISESSVNQILKIPYKETDLSLIIYLPIKGKIPLLTKGCLEAKFIKKKVKVNLPEFNISNKINIQAFLKEIGITYLFDNHANFSKIDKEDLIYLSKFKQQNKIEVDKKGTKAYSETTTVGRTKSKVSRIVPITFKANKPFYFTIVDGKNNILLFGRLVDPTKGGKK